VSDRQLVFWALIVTILLMGALVFFKGCGAGDPVVIQLGSVATGLAGALAGISHGQASKITTSSNPPDGMASTMETK
jgi:NAD/NADP transhydrogenase beta subunit